MKPEISLNRLAEYQSASKKKRARIISEQKNPNPFKIRWYQTARATIRRYIANNGDNRVLFEVLKQLTNKKGTSKRQTDEIKVSLEALNLVANTQLPIELINGKITIVKPEKKTLNYFGVQIVVSPDIILKLENEQGVFYGGVKIHISKHNKFDYSKSLIVASMLYRYLKSELKDESKKVLPSLCFSFDVFGEEFISAEYQTEYTRKGIQDLCIDIIKNWDAA